MDSTEGWAQTTPDLELYAWVDPAAPESLWRLLKQDEAGHRWFMRTN